MNLPRTQLFSALESAHAGDTRTGGTRRVFAPVARPEIADTGRIRMGDGMRAPRKQG